METENETPKENQTILTGIVPKSEFEIVREKLLAGTVDRDGKPKMRRGRIPLSQRLNNASNDL